MLHGEFGNKQGDIDLHVRREDADAVQRVVEDLLQQGFKRVPFDDDYKISLTKDDRTSSPFPVL